MTQQFENFVNSALDKSLASDVTLPTANKIPVYTGIGRQVTAKTAAELDIAIKSDVDTGLSNKEPTITAGTSAQYFRGDKTWQTLNTDAVSETESRVYLNPEQKTVATQAASSSQSGYLTSTDWSTFNGKQAALVSGTNIKTVNSSSLLGSGDLVVGEQSVVLLEQDGSQTLSVGKRHYLPRLTIPYTLNLNAPTGAAIGDWFILESRYSASLDGIGLSAFLLGINLKMAAGEYVIGNGDIVSPNAIPLLNARNNSTNSPNFTNGCSFRFTKVTATAWALQPTYGAVMPERFLMKVGGTNSGGTLFVSTAVAGTYATVTLPTKDANLGDLPSVATTDGNALSGTRTRILGGSSNTLYGTDTIAIGCSNNGGIWGIGATYIALHNTGGELPLTFPKGTTVLGSSLHPLFTTFNGQSPCGGALATTVGLCTLSLSANGVTNSITTDAAAPANTNTPRLVGCGYSLIDGNPFINIGSSAVHDVEFIVAFGVITPLQSITRTFYAKRRVYVAYHSGSWANSIEVVGTDTNLGTVVGTVTVGFTLDTTNNRFVPTISATGGQYYQVSVRVNSHYNNKV